MKEPRYKVEFNPGSFKFEVRDTLKNGKCEGQFNYRLLADKAAEALNDANEVKHK